MTKRLVILPIGLSLSARTGPTRTSHGGHPGGGVSPTIGGTGGYPNSPSRGWENSRGGAFRAFQGCRRWPWNDLKRRFWAIVLEAQGGGHTKGGNGVEPASSKPVVLSSGWRAMCVFHVFGGHRPVQSTIKQGVWRTPVRLYFHHLCTPLSLQKDYPERQFEAVPGPF